MPNTSRPHITFLHANGYPSGVYRQFFAALQGRHAVVDAPEILATTKDCAPHHRWPQMLEQVLAETRSHSPKPTRRAIVGHSMGGYIALQTAARHPERFSDVVLLDSPIPTGWRANLLSLSQLTGLAYRAGPAPIAARRRDRWPSRDAAREFFQAKAFVRRWAPGVLDDFIAHALVATGDNDEVTLRIPRDVERDIYAHIVHSAARRALGALRRTPVRVSFIAGQMSEETRMAGYAANERLFAPRFHSMPNGHLIPLEAPAPCAEMLLDILKS
ncbi:MAG: alpha/beta hydrolase [Burkholderiales bacterium]|nr:alpha/beta hydrolase [Burkholderiales bacterium]